MADRNQYGKRTINFWQRYISPRGQRNADLAPAGDGRLYQGGRTRGVDDSPGSGEITYGSPKDRFGKGRRG